jgi:hypothetical protein
MICTAHQVLVKSRRLKLVGYVAIWGAGELHAGYGRGNLEVKDRFEDLGVDISIISKCIFKNLDAEIWIGLIWLRIRTGRRRL